MGTDWEQLPKIPVRYRFSRLFDYGMRRHLRGFGKQHDNSGQSAQRDFLPCSLHRYPLFFPVQIRRTGKIHFQRTLKRGHIPQKGGLRLAYVPVPKDLSKVKTKVALNLTKRQIICFAAALILGLPLFFLLKDSAGTSLASMVMIAVMLPCFLIAMYEKHGQPLEVVVKNIIQTKFIAPKERPYQTENLYAVLERQRKLEKEVSAIAKGKSKHSGKKPRRG